MKLFIDPQVFWWQRFGGVSRYFAELLEDFRADESIDLRFPLRAHDNAHLREKQLYPNAAAFEFLHSLSFRGADRVRWWLLRQRDPVLREMKRGTYDLYVPTFFDPYFLDHKRDVPLVVTVHDMTHEVSPDSFPLDQEFVANKKRLIEAADRVIAVSEATRRDIVRFYPATENKIDVVYHGHSMDPSLVEPVEVPGTYLLFVGKRWLYKNFDFLLGAFSKIARDYADLHLVCAGGGSFTNEELRTISERSLRGRVHYRHINDRRLAYLYRNASCFVFPSANEGFGFPILEAMSCRCPVILPRATCFPEVAGEAALYYEDESGLVEQIQAVLEERIDRNALVDRGLSQAASYSWERCARETKAVYRSVL
jgi:glycosyltransferase involved in cell wall biosynthesis